MRQLNILVLRDDLDPVMDAIAHRGVVHLADPGELDDCAGDLSPASTPEIVDRLNKLEKKIRDLAQGIGITDLPRAISREAKYLSMDRLSEAEKTISGLDAELSALVLDRESKKAELDKLLAISSELRLFAPLGHLGLGTGASFIRVETGRISRNAYPLLQSALAAIPHVLTPLGAEADTVTIIAICLKKDGAVLAGALKNAAFKQAAIPPGLDGIPGEARKGLAEKEDRLRRELAGLDALLAEARRRHGRFLRELIERINCTKLFASARKYFRKTESALLITGWVPSAQAPALAAEIKRLTRGRCYIQARNPADVPGVREGRIKVPVLFKNPIFIRPFELLTSTFGIPAYNAIDPTLFVAVTFLIMFGVMFGDIGDGLALAVVGSILVSPRYAKRYRKAGALILYCGVSSLLFGFLYGSVFGVEEWFRPLWFRPMDNIVFFMKAAVYFGIALVSLGIIINIIDAWRRRDWIGGVFDRTGLLAGVIYWGCIGLIARYAALKEEAGIDRTLIFAVVAAPVILLFLKGPVSWLAGRGGRLFPEGVLTYIMEMIIQTVEIFLGFLANTLSFVRVAAFALAHVMLFTTVFAMADAVRGGAAGPLFSILLIILGNILIIVLEGAIVTIQALRLEYYEFFGKFFTREGELYEPIKIG